MEHIEQTHGFLERGPLKTVYHEYPPFRKRHPLLSKYGLGTMFMLAFALVAVMVLKPAIRPTAEQTALYSALGYAERGTLIVSDKGFVYELLRDANLPQLKVCALGDPQSTSVINIESPSAVPDWIKEVIPIGHPRYNELLKKAGIEVT